MNLTTCPFEDVVDAANDDLRGHRIGGLRDIEVAPRWWAALASIHASVEGQLAVKRARWEARRAELNQKLLADQRSFNDTPPDKRDRVKARMIDHQRDLSEARGMFYADRVKTLEFRALVEQAMAEARWLKDQSGVMAVRCRLLETAIREHRDGLDPEDASDADERLWEVL